MKFLKNPEYLAVKVLLVTVLSVGAGYFVHQNAHFDALSNKGLVYGDAGAGPFGVGTKFTTNLSTVPNTDNIATGDFNADGKQDVVVTDSSNNSINVYFGNGLGGYAYAGGVVAGLLPTGITTGDFNEDGNLDVAISTNTHDTYVYIGNGLGGFTTGTAFPMFFTGGGGIVAGDVDEDGNLDILVSLITRGGVQTYYGAGDGTFTAGLAGRDLFVTGTCGGLAIGDYNEDGHLDLLMSGGTAVMEVHTGDGAGNFTYIGNVPGSNPAILNIATGDYNQDDHLDISYIVPVSNRFQIVYGAGDGTFSGGFSSAVYAGGSLLSVASGDMDLNGSGYMDLVSATGSNSFVTFLNPPPLMPINVTASNPDGTYGVGAHIYIQVQLNMPATVTGGIPTMTVQGDTFAAPVSIIPYVSGSGTDTLTFDFVVPVNFEAADLEYYTAGIAPTGALIRDAATGTMTLRTALFAQGAAGSLSYNKNIVIDGTRPVLTEVTPVSTPNTSATPDYSFSSTKPGTISYGGSCASATTSAVSGTNAITLSMLAPGTYNDCTIIVTDAIGNASLPLAITSFTIVAAGGGTTGSGTTGSGTSGGGTSGGVVIFNPVLTEIMPVATPSTNQTPQYSFSSNESGTITYGGECASPTTMAANGQNTVTFAPLQPGTYRTCTIQILDLAGRRSNVLSIPAFTILPIVVEPTEPVNPKPKPPIKPTPPTIPTVPATPTPTPTPEPEEPIVILPIPGSENVPTPEPEPAPASEVASEPARSCDIRTSTTVLGMIKDEVLSMLCGFAPKVANAWRSASLSYETFGGTVMAEIIAAAAIVSAFLLSVPSEIFLDPLATSEILLIPGRLFSLLLAGLGLRKKSAPWGTTYDSVTKKALDPVRLILTTPDGKVVKRTMTDTTGSYSFGPIAPGNYVIQAAKSGYRFPLDTALAHDDAYGHLYQGGVVTVTDGTLPHMNIPLQPIGFKWSAVSASNPHSTGFYKTIEVSSIRLADLFFYVALAVSVAAIILGPNPIILSILVASLLFQRIRSQMLSAHAFGYVKDGETGKPISFGIVRVTSGVTGKDLADVVLDATGKYSYKTPNGPYRLRIDRKNPDGTYHTLKKDVEVTAKHGYLAEDVSVVEQKDPVEAFIRSMMPRG